MPSYSSFLFESFPREVGNPFRQTISREKELIQFASKNDGEKDVFITIYNLNLEVDKLFYDFDEPFAFEFASKFARYLFYHNYAYIPLVTPRKGFHIYVLIIPKILDGEEAQQKATLADAQLHLIERSGCYYPVVHKQFPVNKKIKPYYKNRGKVDSSLFHLISDEPIAQATFLHDEITAYIRIPEKDYDENSSWYTPACDLRIIGDLRRFGRVPNTKKKIEGQYAYCTYLPLRFFQMEEEIVLQSKKAPQSMPAIEGTVYDIDKFLQPLEIEFNRAIIMDLSRELELPEYEPEIPLLKLIKRIINPGVFRANLSPEPPQEARFELVAELKELGYTIEKVMNVCKAFNKNGSWQDFNESICYTQVKQIFRKNYRKMRRNKLLQLGLATKKDFETMKKRSVFNLKD